MGGLVTPTRPGPWQLQRAGLVRVERRRSRRDGHTLTGSLACDRCDAPVSPGATPQPITAQMSCPFCGHRATLREFLSLARPVRPARVLVRLALGPPAA